ncbi:MAG TPA: TonB family protein [Bryobacteraceae bacterium]|jgi:protein TonB|nr:TonB family protein [Bryobacteraceae bacterium]
MGVHTGDNPEPFGKAFTGSLVTHAAAIALLMTSGLWNLHNNWGSVHASSGSVGVTMVSQIPIPHREAPVNPLANDTKSVVPQEPTPVKAAKPVEVPVKDAIQIPKQKQKRLPPTPARLNFHPPEYKSNQVYSQTPQAASTAMYGTRGSGGIDVGPASVLGSRFGGYSDLIVDRISQHWVRAGVQALPSQVATVSFTIARNGTVTNVQVSQPSGSYLLDTSAKRAVLDASPLPPLPAEFTKNDATVELKFQLQQ